MFAEDLVIDLNPFTKYNQNTQFEGVLDKNFVRTGVKNSLGKTTKARRERRGEFPLNTELDGVGRSKQTRQLYLLKMETVLILLVAWWASGRVRKISPPPSSLLGFTRSQVAAIPTKLFQPIALELRKNEVMKG